MCTELLETMMNRIRHIVFYGLNITLVHRDVKHNKVIMTVNTS